MHTYMCVTHTHARMEDIRIYTLATCVTALMQHDTHNTLSRMAGGVAWHGMAGAVAWHGMGWQAAWDGMGWQAAWDGMGWQAAWDGMGWQAPWDGMGWQAPCSEADQSSRSVLWGCDLLAEPSAGVEALDLKSQYSLLVTNRDFFNRDSQTPSDTWQHQDLETSTQ